MNNRWQRFFEKQQPTHKAIDAPAIPGSVSSRAGFTLVELIIALAIAAILIGVAAPNVQSFFGKAKLSGRVSALQGAINFGRSEAIKRGAAVGLCARGTDTSCATTNPWSEGWLVFVDSNAAGTQGKLDSGEEVLRIGRFPGTVVTVKAKAIVRPNALGSVNTLRFNARGMADWTVGTFVLCDSRGSPRAEALIVNGAGVVRAVEPLNGAAAKDASGSAVSC